MTAPTRSAPPRRQGRRSRGISIVEAIVAMAVMAFGMLAIVGLQSTMRLNSDVAKQRSEATRLAQEAIEDWRAYSSIGTVAGRSAYDDIPIGALADVNVTGYTTNTSYVMSRNVSLAFAQSMKSLQVIVTWTDRNGQAQRVELDTLIARADPSMSGQIALPPTGGGGTHQPLGRHPTIPPMAVDLGGGKSAFKPPDSGGGAVVWVLDNLSGVITSVCSFPGDDLSQLVPATDCAPQPSYLITGVVRFDFGTTPSAATPASLQIAIGMVAQKLGDAFADGECLVAPVQDPKLSFTRYSCRVPQSADTTWTGSTLLVSPLNLADHDVCRYLIPGATGNAAHPQVYVHLDRSLADQNFLVVSEGIACPAGTLPHQPPPPS